MTFTNTNGVEGGKTRQFNMNSSTSDMSGTNVKKGISSAGLLATLLSPLYPRASSGNEGTFPTINGVQNENILQKTDSSNRFNDAIAETGRQASTASSSSYVYNSTSSPTSPGNNKNISINSGANSADLPPRLRSAQSLDNVEGLLHAPSGNLYNKETNNAINSSTNYNYNERWQKQYANAPVPITNSRSQFTSKGQDHLETQMSNPLHNLHPVLSNHDIHHGLSASSSKSSNKMDSDTVFVPFTEKAGVTNSARKTHPGSPCTPHVSSYHQCLELNPDMKSNCNWAFEKIMKCQENRHAGYDNI